MTTHKIYTFAAAMIGLISSITLQNIYGKEVGCFFWNIKSELFSGLFTISGLLLSVKTYIIVKLKENIYSKESYIDSFVDLKASNKTTDESHLAPLVRFSEALTTAVATCAIAAILQLVAAAIGPNYSALLGLSAASAAAGSLTFCWIQIRNNLTEYFKHLEKESKEEMRKAETRYRSNQGNEPTIEVVGTQSTDKVQ